MSYHGFVKFQENTLIILNKVDKPGNIEPLHVSHLKCICNIISDDLFIKFNTALFHNDLLSQVDIIFIGETKKNEVVQQNDIMTVQ